MTERNPEAERDVLLAAVNRAMKRLENDGQDIGTLYAGLARARAQVALGIAEAPPEAHATAPVWIIAGLAFALGLALGAVLL